VSDMCVMITVASSAVVAAVIAGKTMARVTSIEVLTAMRAVSVVFFTLINVCVTRTILADGIFCGLQ